MNVIMLVGANSCGKTTSLNMVYQMLLANGGVSTNKRPLGGNQKDFSDIVLMLSKKIAIFTMGDYSKPLVEAMKDYNVQGVDVMVCACNIKLVRPFAQIKNYQHHIVNKTLASPTLSQKLANTNDANIIFGLI